MRSKILIMSLICLMFVLKTTLLLAEDPVKIGVITVLSGPFAVLGNLEANAAKMVVEEYGPVLGKKVELFIRDNAFSAGLSVERAKELYEKEKVDAIFCVPHGAGSLGVSDQALKNKKIFFANSTSSTDLIARNRYTFKWTYNNYVLNTAMGTFGPQYFGKKCYTITADYASAHDGLKFFLASFKKKGGEHLGNDFVALGTSDFSPYILKAKQANPDVLALINFGKDTINCTRAAVEYGLKKQMKIFYADITEIDIKEAGIDICSGGFRVIPWYWKLENPGNREFGDRFYKKYGSRPILAAGGTYSAVWQYLEAVKRVGTKDTIPVIKALENYTFRDLFANPGYIRAEDHLMVAKAFLFKIKSPEEVKEEEDFFELVGTLPAEEVNPDPNFFGRKLGDF